MSHFVLLDHDYPHPHFDLMLEVDEVLWTWRLEEVPSEGQGRGERIADHRLFYLDHEGAVSGNRGRVLRRAHGTYEWLLRADEKLQVSLTGVGLNGTLTLTLQVSPWWTVQLTE